MFEAFNTEEPLPYPSPVVPAGRGVAEVGIPVHSDFLLLPFCEAVFCHVDPGS